MTAYAVLTDLYAYGLAAVAMGSVSTASQQKILDARNDYADDKLRARYVLPLLAPIPESLKQNICQLAAWDCLVLRGYNPQSGADVSIRERADLALKWFDDVERQRAHPNVVESSTASPGLAAPMIISKPVQGW